MRLLPSSRRLLPHAFLGAAIACMPLPEWLPCHADGASGSDSQSAVLADSDGDGVDDSMDCRPVDATTWSVPSEARSLALHGGAATTFTWSGPASPGASMPTLRSHTVHERLEFRLGDLSRLQHEQHRAGLHGSGDPVTGLLLPGPIQDRLRRIPRHEL